MFSSSIMSFMWHSWNFSGKTNADNEFRYLLVKVQICDLTWICSWEYAQKNLNCAFTFHFLFPAQFIYHAFMNHPLISKLQSFSITWTLVAILFGLFQSWLSARRHKVAKGEDGMSDLNRKGFLFCVMCLLVEFGTPCFPVLWNLIRPI